VAAGAPAGNPEGDGSHAHDLGDDLGRRLDDELVPRESGLALFDAFTSREKTLHANAGRHMAVPRFEVDSSERFFARHLAGGPKEADRDRRS
jgi:hypothetical protein